MKRVFVRDKVVEEESPLLNSDILEVMRFYLTEANIVYLDELLPWYSVNKNHYQYWLDRKYFLELVTLAGKRSLLLFERERHGYYLENERRLAMISVVLPMIDMLFNEIINKIRVKELDRFRGKYQYYSEKDATDRYLSLERLIPVAYNGCKSDLVILLSSYMLDRHGWVIEVGTHTTSRLGFFNVDGNNGGPNQVIFLKPVTKKYMRKGLK